MKKVSMLATMLIATLITGCDSSNPNEDQPVSYTETIMKDEQGNPVKVITTTDNNGNTHNTFVDTMTGAIVGSMIGNITGNYLSSQILDRDDDRRRGSTYIPLVTTQTQIYSKSNTAEPPSSSITDKNTTTKSNISSSTKTTTKPSITARGSSFKGMSGGFGG